MNFLKRSLNRVSMYRLTLFVLSGYVLILSLAGLVGILQFNSFDILFQVVWLVLIANVFNRIFAKFFGAVANLESASITALILALILGPYAPGRNIIIMSLIVLASISSKYILVFRKRHIFNPAAVGALAASFVGGGASWWVGSPAALPFVVFGGVLIIAKLKRFGLVGTFLTSYLFLSFLSGVDITKILLDSPIIFFATVMLIEPLTSPSITKKQVYYALFVSLCLGAIQKFLGIEYNLELSLVFGNLVSYIMSKPFRVSLFLEAKEKLNKDIYAFYFKPERRFDFLPGQYMQFTLPHKNPDSRGIRRYFSLASSPNQEEIMIATRIVENSSSFKRALKDLKKGDVVVGMDLSGEFTLPKDASVPLAFIAGGIGITPFLSMFKFMIEREETRDIALLYSNSKEEDIAFRDLLVKVERLGVRTIFVVTEKDGRVDEEMIKEKIPDWRKRYFYVSGPQPMVEVLSKLLSKMGVKKIKLDFFPGYTE